MIYLDDMPADVNFLRRLAFFLGIFHVLLAVSIGILAFIEIDQDEREEVAKIAAKCHRPTIEALYKSNLAVSLAESFFFRLELATGCK